MFSTSDIDANYPRLAPLNSSLEAFVIDQLIFISFLHETEKKTVRINMTQNIGRHVNGMQEMRVGYAVVPYLLYALVNISHVLDERTPKPRAKKNADKREVLFSN